MEETIDRVLRTHPSIAASQRDIDAAQARIGQARSGYWPRVSAVATYRRQDPVPEVTVPGGASGPGGSASGGRSIGIQPNNLYDGHVEVRQTLYDFGRTTARVEQARAGRTTAERRTRLERSRLAFETIQAFYGTLLAEARVELQRDQIAQLRRTLDVVRRRQEAGAGTDFEVQSTRTRLSAARSQLATFRSQQRSRTAELRQLLGTPQGDSLRLEGSLRRSAVEGGGIGSDSLARQARRRHPSVRIAKAQLEAARRSAEVVDQSDAPSLALTAQGGVKNGYPGDLNEPRLNESVGVSLQVPLFDGFSTRRRVDEAEASVAAAEARLNDVQRQIDMQVTQAALELQAQREKRMATSAQVEQARSAAELARTRYEAGTITNLDLLEAETELQRARLSHTEALYGVILGRCALQRAAGTLLPFQPLSP